MISDPNGKIITDEEAFEEFKKKFPKASPEMVKKAMVGVDVWEKEKVENTNAIGILYHTEEDAFDCRFSRTRFIAESGLEKVLGEDMSNKFSHGMVITENKMIKIKKIAFQTNKSQVWAKPQF